MLYGDDVLSQQFVRRVEVGTKKLQDLITFLQDKPGTLLVTSASRFGALLGMLFVAQSGSIPNMPGILLTGARA